MKKHSINPKDISVVVQGLIVGSKDSPCEARHTLICLESIRKHLPGAQVILSTWKGSNTEGLDYDVLVENEDPGTNIMGEYVSNCFRQIVSTMNGLNKCQTKYAIKIRSDIELQSTNFINLFEEYRDLPFDDLYKVLKQRVVIMTTCNPHRRYKLPFTASDWFYFGTTEDLKDIFDITLIEKHEYVLDKAGNKYLATNPYYPEQYMWTQFLSKHKEISFTHSEDISHNNIELSERYFANNTIMLNARQIRMKWLKSPGKVYSQTPSFSNSGLYTFNEYKKLLNTYSLNNLVIIPDPIESICYFVVYNLRFIVKKLYMGIRNLLLI